MFIKFFFLAIFFFYTLLFAEEKKKFDEKHLMIDELVERVDQPLHNLRQKQFFLYVGTGMYISDYAFNNGAIKVIGNTQRAPSLNLGLDMNFYRMPIRRSSLAGFLGYTSAFSSFDLSVPNQNFGNAFGYTHRVRFDMKYRFFPFFELYSPRIDFILGFEWFYFTSNAPSKAAAQDPFYNNLIVDYSYLSPVTGLSFEIPDIIHIKNSDFSLIGDFEYFFKSTYLENPANASGNYSSNNGIGYGGGIVGENSKGYFVMTKFMARILEFNFSGESIYDDTPRSNVENATVKDTSYTILISLGYRT